VGDVSSCNAPRDESRDEVIGKVPMKFGTATACVAEWKGDYLEVWYHGQAPNKVLQTLSAAGYAKQDRITINAGYMGAQFGGLNWSKSISNVSGFTSYAVAAARRTRKPVKVLWDESSFEGGEETNGRRGFQLKFAFAMELRRKRPPSDGRRER
jgi:xanthine dehydrogenase molybdopterin-binding subunit B